jgi:hypothetical protein
MPKPFQLPSYPPSISLLSPDPQTLLHLVQMILSYFLMLIAMTYNSWLFGAVVTGAAAGWVPHLLY